MRRFLALATFVGMTSLVAASDAAAAWGCLAHLGCGSLDMAGISWGESSKDSTSGVALERCTAERSKHWLACLGGSSCSIQGCWDDMDTRDQLCRHIVHSRERWEYAGTCP